MPDVSDRLHDSAETFEKKTEDYGDSWRKIGEILLNLSHGEPVVLETKEDFVSFGLFTRRLDKFARAFHGEFAAEDMNFESIVDAHMDEGVYAMMAAENQDSRRDNSKGEPKKGAAIRKLKNAQIVSGQDGE